VSQPATTCFGEFRDTKCLAARLARTSIMSLRLTVSIVQGCARSPSFGSAQGATSPPKLSSASRRGRTEYELRQCQRRCARLLERERIWARRCRVWPDAGELSAAPCGGCRARRAARPWMPPRGHIREGSGRQPRRAMVLPPCDSLSFCARDQARSTRPGCRPCYKEYNAEKGVMRFARGESARDQARKNSTDVLVIKRRKMRT